LNQEKDFVAKVIKEEEESFLRTLDKGLKRMDDIIATAKESIIKGTDAFELLDTFGFPIDLTRLIAQENNLMVDEAGFEKEMQEQKDRSRAATAMDMDDWQLFSTDKSNGFVGYDQTSVQTHLLRYRKVTGKGKELYQLVLDKTPFYAESGGQVGDTGQLIFGEGNDTETIQILDTKKENDLIIHLADQLPVRLDGILTARIDEERRNNITVHHSATHLMHAALREVLGKHVAQKGSLVNDEQLRFDFSHFAKVSDAELQEVEKIVNRKIRENIPIVIKSMPKDEAIKLGAMALFGEKYGDTVRVVIMDPNYSIELCGGTHVGCTGAIGYFRIRSESAVAAGVRRIEAVSGQAAEALLNEENAQLMAARALLKNPKDITKAIESLQ
jgi:alanyl-tRNA synthetase